MKLEYNYFWCRKFLEVRNNTVTHVFSIIIVISMQSKFEHNLCIFISHILSHNFTPFSSILTKYRRIPEIHILLHNFYTHFKYFHTILYPYPWLIFHILLHKFHIRFTYVSTNFQWIISYFPNTFQIRFKDISHKSFT